MSTPHHDPSPSQNMNNQFSFPYNGDQNSYNQQQQPNGDMPGGYYPNQASSIPGAPSGGGDPGPSSMQAQGMFRPSVNNFGQMAGMPGGMNPSQIAALQQMAQARAPSGAPQWTPQQLHAAMQVMQSGGGGNQQAAFQAAMRQQQQQQNQNGQAQQQFQPRPPTQNGVPGRSGTPNQQHRPPMQNPMPPPPLPVQQQQQMSNSPNRPPQQQLSFTMAQQQQFTQARNNLLQDPRFQAMPQPQQAQHLTQMQQQLMRQFATQNGFGPQGQQPTRKLSQSSTGQQEPPRPDSAQGHPQQSPSSQRQQLPGHTMSSLPQHMAPQRPGSAASQRIGSPQVPGSPVRNHAASPIAYPPPTPNSQGPPSPAASIHSHHSHHTPQAPTHLPPPARSTASPGPMHTPGQPQNGQMGQGQQTAQTPHRQSATPGPSEMSSGAFAGTPGGTPQPPAVQSLQFQNLSHFQQQSLGSAMSIFNNAAQAQGQGSPAVRPPVTAQQMMGRPPMRPPGMRPPMPNIDMSDFPFDWRLLTQFPNLQDENWRNLMLQRNPGNLAQVQSALAMVQSGNVRTDILNRMQQMVAFHKMQMQHMQQQQALQNQQQQQTQLQQAANRSLPPQQSQGPSPQTARPPPVGQQSQPAGWGAPAMSPAPAAPTKPPSAAKNKAANPPKQATPAANPELPTPVVDAPAAPPFGLPLRINAQTGLPVKDWERHVNLSLPVTNIVPLADEDPTKPSADPTFNGRLKPLDSREKRELRHFMHQDEVYVKGLEAQKKQARGRILKWARANDMETPWWMARKGERPKPPGGRLSIVWPNDKIQQRARTTHKGRNQIKFTPFQLKAMANVQDQVVPVRIDVEHEQWKIKDTFMWNCADTVVTAELFAQSLCDDFGVPPIHFVSKIVTVINERVREYKDQVLPIMARSPEVIKGKMDSQGDDESRAMCRVFAQMREGSEETDSGEASPRANGDDHVKDEPQDLAIDYRSSIDLDETPMTVEEAMSLLHPDVHEDYRILIKVDIMVGTQCLTDTFEWDLNSSVTPEEFAALHVKELGLSGEFATALAHDIHEQILVHKRSLFLVGHTPGSGLILDDEVKSAFLPPLTAGSTLRKEDIAMSTYTPIFAKYTEEDVLAIERERERESKRKKRAGRARRGITLPDREPLKTHRSLINPVGPNGLVPLQATEEVSLPAGTTSRRAAAIAAQASINLMSQDLPPPSPSTNHPLPAVKKHRGGPGRGNRTWRASPATSFRESSVGREASVGTPSVLGGKRSLREDSVTETVESPLHKRRNNGRGESPSESAGAQTPMSAVPIKLDQPEPIRSNDGKWRCYNCGVSEQFASRVRTNPKTGLRNLCETCCEFTPSDPKLISDRYTSRNGTARPCEYTEDEAIHQQRFWEGKRRAGKPVMDPSLDPPETANRARSRSSSTEVPSQQNLASQVSTTTLVGNTDQDDDDDSSDSSDSDSSSLAPVKRGRVVSAASATSPGAPKKTTSPPAWTKSALADLSLRYPDDDVAIIKKAKKPGDQVGGEVEWRVKCADCPGKIYTLGPGETLSNFEVHLKNRAHIEKRQARAGRL